MWLFLLTLTEQQTNCRWIIDNLDNPSSGQEELVMMTY